MDQKARLPITEAQWQEYIDEEAENDSLLTNTSIHTMQEYNSGSAIKRPQFLLLRILCRAAGAHQLLKHPQNQLTDAQITDAGKRLIKSSSWKAYLDSLLLPKHQLSKMPPWPDLGFFLEARMQQHEVERIPEDLKTESAASKFTPIITRSMTASMEKLSLNHAYPLATPTPAPRYALPSTADHIPRVLETIQSPSTPSTSEARGPVLEPYTPASGDNGGRWPPAQDEQDVNSALIAFLRAVTATFVGGYWSSKRLAFHFTEPNSGTKLWEARVDGYLRVHSHRGDEVKAIIEVKPIIRNRARAQIRMQEAAQMAAWVSSHAGEWEVYRDSNECIRLLLVSQDRHEVYLTIACFDVAYVDYLRGKPVKSFLTMHEFGPFLFSDPDRVEILARYILAYTTEAVRLARKTSDSRAG